MARAPLVTDGVRPADGATVAGRRLAARSLGRFAALVASVAALAVVTWPIGSTYPTTGIEGSWQGGLHLAARDGLKFGSDIIFTYGPLGFLTVPELWYLPTGIAAYLFVGLAHVATVAALAIGLRRVAPTWFALVVLTVGLVALTQVPVARLMVWWAAIASIAVVTGSASARLVRWFPAVAGIASAFTILVKFNEGIGVAAICTIAIVVLAVRSNARAMVEFLATSLVSLVVMWTLLGQRLEDLVPFLTASVELTTGYSTAMGRERVGREWELAAAALCLTALLALVARESRTRDRSTSWGVMAIAAVIGFLAFKHGFVRHDPTHAIPFFAFLVLMAVPFVRRPDGATLGSIGLLSVVLILSVGRDPIAIADPIGRANRFVDQSQLLFDADQREEGLAKRVAAMREEYLLDAQTLALVEGQRVHVEPWEASIAWAYAALRWDAPPVFQSYSAYTDALDDANAAALASADGPTHILRRADAALDGRNPGFESPAATLAVACHFRELHATPIWQVVERTPNRCGAPRLLDRRQIALGEWIEIPDARSDEIVYATIDGVRDGVGERLRAMIYRSEPVLLWASGEDRWRLVPETADQPLILRAPADIGYSETFLPGIGSEQFRVTYADIRGDEEVVLDVEFYAMRLSGAP